MSTVEDAEILLVEDNPNDVELALRALRKQNLDNKVFVVRDGAEALDFIFAAGPYSTRKMAPRPKVVLLDLKLPKIDGIEVLRRMKADERTSNIPIVMLTSSQEERDVAESYKLGVNSYIVKPVDFEQFSDSMKQLGLYWMLLHVPPPSAGAPHPPEPPGH